MKTVAFTKAIYTVIRRYVDQAFNDMSEESEKKLSTLSLRNRCGLFHVKALLSRPKNNGKLRPSEVLICHCFAIERGIKTPENEETEMRLNGG